MKGKRASVITLAFYALIGAVAISLVYDLVSIIKYRAKDIDYNLAKANYYRILALSHLVNSTNKSVELTLGDCWVKGENDTLIVNCLNSPYMDKTDLPIIGFAKGKAIISKKNSTIVISGP